MYVYVFQTGGTGAPPQAAKQVIEKEGVIGLVTRGLGTRLMTNGIQASLFSIVWKMLEEQFAKGGL